MNSKNNRGYINVDELIEKTPLDLVLQHYGLPLSNPHASEYRMNCVFNDACKENAYGNLSVELHSANLVYAHCCRVRGNLLTLIHGLENRSPPGSGKLRGQEFKNAANKLREINGLADSAAMTPPPPRGERGMAREVSTPTPSTPVPSDERGNEENQPQPVAINVPLIRHEKEAARALADLHKDLITDVSQMSPEAAAYVRKRPWMTPELMEKWGIGWIPGNGRSLFRKHYLVYTHRNTRGEIISYSGRDLNYETKIEKYIKQGRPDGKKPAKHRYVSGYKRGAELYGGYSPRLQEPGIKESLEKYGLVVVEGANDCIRMDELGVCAVALCSNNATDQQVTMLTKFARQVADNRIMLLPDCDEEGEAGFSKLLWRLAEDQLVVTLGMTSRMYSGKFAQKQPEGLTRLDLSDVILARAAYNGDTVESKNRNVKNS
ncbi:DNA primase [bacterium]|nr:DNA primase [bacterium]